MGSWSTPGTETALFPVLDPVLVWTLRLSLALLLGRAVMGKLRSPAAFAEAIHGYALLPAVPGLERAVAGALLALEAAIGLALLAPPIARLAALTAAGLLLLYTGAIAWNLARGRRDIDCGCAGPLRRAALHEGLVARNALYIAAALAAALPAGTRALLWLDALTVALAVGVLGVLAAAFDDLAARAPVLAPRGGAA